MLPAGWMHGEWLRPCYITDYLLLYVLPASNRTFNFLSKESRVKRSIVPSVLTECHSTWVDSHQRKCSILSTQVLLSDGCLQSELGCSAAAAWGANVKSTEDFSTAFHRQSGDAMWGHTGVNTTPRECLGPSSCQMCRPFPALEDRETKHIIRLHRLGQCRWRASNKPNAVVG